LDFFAAFFAAFFAVFFAIFDILVCLAIKCVPQSKSPSLSDVASPMSRGDEIKLDPNTLSLINASSGLLAADTNPSPDMSAAVATVISRVFLVQSRHPISACARFQ
jgi:hypothetical protein